MPLLTAKKLAASTYSPQSNLFSLLIEQQLLKTQIIMKVHTEFVNTREIPWTFSFLEQHLPTILASKCFNEENIPFSVEVTRTELGHLFEHMLLEFLCQEKLMKGFDEAVFSGRTNWNWEKEPIGLFHIHIGIQSTDWDIFSVALEKTVSLFERMILYPEVGNHIDYPLLRPLSTK